VANASLGERLEIEILGNDFVVSEVAVESAHSGGAEGASHRAADLGADAAADAFFVGEEDGLEDLVIAIVDKDFIDVISAFSVIGEEKRGDDVLCFELITQVFGEVFEIVEGLGGLFVDPVGDLPSAIRFVPELDDDLFKFGPGFTY